VLWRFVGLVDDEDTPVRDGAEQRRVCVADHAAFERRLEHELLRGRVAVKLDVLARALEKL
jgi:hypothetical protein